jgi:DNA segregation ATPase FtsK/SpoIIIE, S-DNA-T family
MVSYKEIKELMRSHHSYHRQSFLPEAMRQSVRDRLMELWGLGLMALAITLGLALISWSVQDPSVMHATTGGVQNWLGTAGAVASDILMQMFGLGSILIVIPMALWGLRLVREHNLDREKLRLSCWLMGGAAAAGAASMLPPAGRWPLPTGLGGMVGDAIKVLPVKIFGPSWEVSLITGTVLFIAAIICLKIAAGYGPRGLIEESRVEDLSEEEEFDDEDEGTSSWWAWASLGGLVHIGLSVKALMQRLKGRWSRDAEDEEQQTRSRRGIRDVLDRAMDRPVSSYAATQEWDDDDIMEAEPRGRLSPIAIMPPTSHRVAAPAPAPKAGRRISEEAQPSLLDMGQYALPALTYLAEPKKPAPSQQISVESLEQNARLLESVLDDFGVKGEIIQVRPGPVVTLYELEPAPGIKSSRVIGLADDIARSMSAVAARVAVVSGRNAIGIELPNTRRETVYFRELMGCEDYEKSKFKLPLALGKNIGGEPIIADLARMPHLLIAGTTGSGKSVAINTMILSLLYRLKPEECRLIMIDPKMLELSVYEGIPHLLTPVVTDPKKAVVALKWAVHEMEERYKKMSKLGVRNIEGFNQRVAEARGRSETITRTVQTGYDPETGEAIYEQEDMALDPLPFIVVIVDEMADLMMVAGKEIEGAIQRLAQMARAAGIHIIMATQRPSVDVITGTIKANFPTRISFQVTSKIDSRTILGEQGAEQLLGQGDMLYMAGGGRISRIHGPFVSDGEVEKIVNHLKAQGKPQYLDAVTRGFDEEEGGEGGGFDGGSGGAFGDESGDLYDRAVAIVLRDRKASTSYVQRRLQVGYNKAASLIERMEREGVVSAPNHSGKREILVGRQDDAA